MTIRKMEITLACDGYKNHTGNIVACAEGNEDVKRMESLTLYEIVETAFYSCDTCSSIAKAEQDEAARKYIKANFVEDVVENPFKKSKKLHGFEQTEQDFRSRYLGERYVQPRMENGISRCANSGCNHLPDHHGTRGCNALGCACEFFG